MSPRLVAILSVVLATGALSATARAEPENYFTSKPDEVVFRIDKERTTRDKIIIGSIGGGVVLFGAVGAIFTLRYNSKSDQVEAAGMHTGRIYTEELDDTRKSALLARNVAIVGYGLAGAALIGTIVAYVVTDPGTEEVTYGPGGTIQKKRGSTLIAPVEGGAVVGHMWRF